MRKYKTSILVVLYNKTINESETLRSISALNNKNVIVELWNNGPIGLKPEAIKDLDCKLGCTKLVVREYLNNMSLSKIYNGFIQRYISHNVVIFDDDTSINPDYIKDMLEITKNEVALPIIEDVGLIHYPIINYNLENSKTEFSNEDIIYSSMSGVVIGRNVLEKLSEKYSDIFDERFSLYGVDTSFFARLNSGKFNYQGKVISKIEHSLSNNVSEPLSTKKFRSNASGLAEGAFFRNYKSRKSCIFAFLTNICKLPSSYFNDRLNFLYRKSFIKGIVLGHCRK